MSNDNDPAIYLRVEIITDNTNRNAKPEDRVRYSIYVTNYIKLWHAIFDNKGIKKLMSVSVFHFAVSSEYNELELQD